jgi:Rrf2 family protein
VLRLSRKTALAIEAVLDVAYNARPDPVQARDITARQAIPHRYLEAVLQRLVREGILRGVRGPRGGYVLARERRRVSIGDVVRVVSAMEEGEEVASSATELATKVIAPICEDIATEVLARLDAITMDDLCREAESRGIPRADAERSDFSI